MNNLPLWEQQCRQMGRVAVIVIEDTYDGSQFPSFVREGEYVKTLQRILNTPKRRIVAIREVK